MDESDITLGFAEYLDSMLWEIVAVHPPGGHTSFSLLDGRRSFGAYMPDIVAIPKKRGNLKDSPVLLVETKGSFSQSDQDIIKLINLSERHAAWIAFRLQNHIDRTAFEKNWTSLLQKIVLVGDGLDTISKELLKSELIFIEFDLLHKKIKKILYGDSAPLKKNPALKKYLLDR